MSHAEVGAYIRLLCWQWERGPIDDKAIFLLSSMGGVKTESGSDFGSSFGSSVGFDPASNSAVIWVLKNKFVEIEKGKWINTKLEEIRDEMQKRTKVAKENGAKGGRKKTRVSDEKKQTQNQTRNQTENQQPNPEENLEAKRQHKLPRGIEDKRTRRVEEEKEREPIGSCGELVPSTPPQPSEFSFVLADRSRWSLSMAKLAEFEATFPTMDVGAELRKAAQWLVENPTRRKTPSGMGRYLLNWLSKAQNSGRAPSRSGIHDPVDPRGNIRAASSVLSQLTESGIHDGESDHGHW